MAQPRPGSVAAALLDEEESAYGDDSEEAREARHCATYMCMYTRACSHVYGTRAA